MLAHPVTLLGLLSAAAPLALASPTPRGLLDLNSLFANGLDQFVASTQPKAAGLASSLFSLGAPSAEGEGAQPEDTEVVYTACSGTDVSKVTIQPCEGGTGAEGDSCQFTAMRNYTITITYTPNRDVTYARAGLASYDGEEKTAYSGQSFGACNYTPCPITAGEESEYIYYFRTLRAPDFDRLVFNATDGVQGPSFMCASIPVDFKPATSDEA